MSTAAVPVRARRGRMTLIEHLTELRDRLIKVVLAVAIGMVVAFVLYDQIFDFLIEPYVTGRRATNVRRRRPACWPSTRSRASACA